MTEPLQSESEAMSDEEQTMAALKTLTPAQVRLLGEFAENMRAGRRVMKWIAWLVGAATGLAALVYYVTAILRQRVG